MPASRESAGNESLHVRQRVDSSLHGEDVNGTPTPGEGIELSDPTPGPRVGVQGPMANRRELHFVRWAMSPDTSPAALIPVEMGRCGVYVLEFGDGEQYVGQSVSLLARLATHRRRWPDIVAIRFACVVRGSRQRRAGRRSYAGAIWRRASQYGPSDASSTV